MGSSPGQVPHSAIGSKDRACLSWFGVMLLAPDIPAAGISSKITFLSAWLPIRRASIRRGWPFALKCTMPSTVVCLPHKGRRVSTSSESESNRPRSDESELTRRRNRPASCSILSSLPLTMKAFGGGISVNRASIHVYEESSSTKFPCSESWEVSS